VGSSSRSEQTGHVALPAMTSSFMVLARTLSSVRRAVISPRRLGRRTLILLSL